MAEVAPSFPLRALRREDPGQYTETQESCVLYTEVALIDADPNVSGAGDSSSVLRGSSPAGT